MEGCVLLSWRCFFFSPSLVALYFLCTFSPPYLNRYSISLFLSLPLHLFSPSLDIPYFSPFFFSLLPSPSLPPYLIFLPFVPSFFSLLSLPPLFFLFSCSLSSYISTVLSLHTSLLSSFTYSVLIIISSISIFLLLSPICVLTSSSLSSTISPLPSLLSPLCTRLKIASSWWTPSRRTWCLLRVSVTVFCKP